MSRQRRSGRRWAIAAVAPLLLGGFWLTGALDSDDELQLVRVVRKDLVLQVDLTGELHSVETRLLGPPPVSGQWNFKISHLEPEGSEVAKGTPVLSFDDSELRTRLERQIAEAEEARKRIERTERSLEVSRGEDELRLAEAEAKLRKIRLKLATPEGLVAPKELEADRLDLEYAELEVRLLTDRLAAARRSAESQLAALRAQRDRAERQTASIRESIEAMVRKAPEGGTVVYVDNWQDEKPAIGDTVWRSQWVVELPDLTHMRAEGQVDESDSGRLAEGQRVLLRLDAHPDVEFSGTISSIWDTVQRENWRSPRKIVRLEIELDETDRRRMRPGMRFRGEIEIERFPDSLLVPQSAVFRSASGPIVYRKSLFGLDAVRVELGRRDANDVEVLQGLEEGDQVSRTEPAGGAA